MNLAPSGATRLLLYVATTGATFWDNGFDPITDGKGPTLDADTYVEFPNLTELSHLKIAGVGGSCDLYMSWYKSK